MKAVIEFFKKDIWRVKLGSLPKWKAFFVRFFRIIMLTTQGFTKSQIQQGASSLTYYSLLAVVPVLALLIGVARGFLLEGTVEKWLTEHFAEQKDILKQIIKFADSSLQQARGGVIAGVGIAILVWATIQILTNIELVMNQIWEVKKGRTLTKKFTDYLAMVFLAPFFGFLASGLTGYLSARLSTMHEEVLLEKFATVINYVLGFLSYLLISLLFTFIYIFMPNTRVRFIPALIAGIFTGIVYQLLQWLYFYFQIGVASYNAIYGTFAAVPLFLVWLHLSWVITLLGSKISFAIQNVDSYEYLAEDLELSHKIRTVCSLRIAHYCIKRFINEKPPPTAIEISNALAMPHFLTNHLIHQLTDAEILIEIKRNDEEETFFPARNVEHLTIKRVLDMINEKGATIPLPPSKELTLILKSLEKFSQAVEKSDSNILLKNI